MLAICRFGLEAELAQLNHFLYASSSLRYSAHGRLDKAIQSMFMNYLPLYVLIFCSLSEEKITDERVCTLVRELQVNQIYQKLE